MANLRNRAAHHQFRLALVPGRAAESLAQHRAIVEAVTSGDGPAAEAAMRAHLASVIDVLRQWEAFDTALVSRASGATLSPGATGRPRVGRRRGGGARPSRWSSIGSTPSSASSSAAASISWTPARRRGARCR